MKFIFLFYTLLMVYLVGCSPAPARVVRVDTSSEATITCVVDEASPHGQWIAIYRVTSPQLASPLYWTPNGQLSR